MPHAEDAREPHPAVTLEEVPLHQRVREALHEEGFQWELWQKPKRGVLYGLIRRDGEDMQTHVRYYKDDVIRAEREISNDYLEHLISPRESAHEEIERLLANHGIHEVTVSEKDFPERMKGEMPTTRTPWKPLAVGIGAIAGIALSATRFIGINKE